ncbi:TadE/TadG family type IV pilus assembly protein [Streptomyces sp. SAS_281]|uniref:TadE/TadG family type IV pilus assembly protein n=1 Tax=Streptomyces sp. SAS_281 TaxID=3412744 RepID=UPI00403C307E
MNHSRHRALARLRQDTGSVSLYAAIVVVGMLVMIGIAVDGGGKMRATERADAIAQEAARTGGQEIDAGQAITGEDIVADPGAARAAALDYLAAAGAHGSVAVSEDGKKLTVTVTGAYRTRFLPVLGVTEMPVTGHASAVLVHGVQAPEG